jgi:hypothetical protein
VVELQAEAEDHARFVVTGTASTYLPPAMKIKHLPAGFVVSAQPVKAPKPPSGADRVHEIKHHGYRLIVGRDSLLSKGRGVRLCASLLLSRRRIFCTEVPDSGTRRLRIDLESGRVKWPAPPPHNGVATTPRRSKARIHDTVRGNEADGS